MLDFEIRAHFLHHLVIQIGAIVSNDLPRESVPTNQHPHYETDHYTPRDIGVGSHFDPFGEIIYSHENEVMTVRSLGFDGPYDIYSPHGKRPRGGHDIQGMWRSIDIVRKRLTFMAFPYMDAPITFHGEPVITCSQDLPGHSMLVGVRFEWTLVDFLDHVVRLFVKCSLMVKSVGLLWCNPTPQGHWIEDSKKIGPEIQEKALGFSWALGYISSPWAKYEPTYLCTY